MRWEQTIIGWKALDLGKSIAFDSLSMRCNTRHILQDTHVILWKNTKERYPTMISIISDRDSAQLKLSDGLVFYYGEGEVWCPEHMVNSQRCIASGCELSELCFVVIQNGTVVTRIPASYIRKVMDSDSTLAVNDDPEKYLLAGIGLFMEEAKDEDYKDYQEEKDE